MSAYCLEFAGLEVESKVSPVYSYPKTDERVQYTFSKSFCLLRQATSLQSQDWFSSAKVTRRIT